MNVHSERVNDVWGDPSGRFGVGEQWTNNHLVKERQNIMASGNRLRDAYGALAEFCRKRAFPLPCSYACSLGCGVGELERGLIQYGFAGRIEGFDISRTAIATAQRLADEAGYSDILSYRCADLEEETFATEKYGIVFAHQAIHHVRNLERLFENVETSLCPGGIFHLNEYVGPSRFQWTADQLDASTEWLRSIPEKYRLRSDGSVKAEVVRPTPEDVITQDPSESIRSDEILRLLDKTFEIVELKKLGGALCHIALSDIAQNFYGNDIVGNSYLESLFLLEDDLMDRGIVQSDFIVATAVHKTGG